MSKLVKSIKTITERFNRRAWHISNPSEHLTRAASSQGLSKVMGLLDLTYLGLGSIVGAGVYVLSGVVANSVAGPAVIVSYVIAATAALLAAFSYAEFAVDLPVAGGAFNYISVTFGELAAWSVAWNMILETMLSSAAVSRGFSGYLATLLGLAPDFFLIGISKHLQLDPMALLLCVGLSLLLAIGTKESSSFNILISTCNIAAICFVLAVGLPHADLKNITEFAPYGSRGVFNGAAIVFFSYIGFDYLANAAEEAKNPAVDLPWGIISSLSIATVLYVLMSTTIVLMVPYTTIDVNAPFAAAFVHIGMDWVAKVVSFGALMGIVASTMTGLLSHARLLIVLGRQHLLSPRLATLHNWTGTPVIATAVTGVGAGVLALLLDINLLAELVSVGTLYVFFAVCAGVLYRRYSFKADGELGEEEEKGKRKALLRIGAVTASSAGFSLSYTLWAPWPVVLFFAILFITATASMYKLNQLHTPTKFRIPFFPATPCLGILFTVHLVCSLGWPAYVRFAVWNVIGFAVYVGYGMHHADWREREERMGLVAEDGSGGGGGDVVVPALSLGRGERDGVELTASRLSPVVSVGGGVNVNVNGSSVHNGGVNSDSVRQGGGGVGHSESNRLLNASQQRSDAVE